MRSAIAGILVIIAFPLRASTPSVPDYLPVPPKLKNVAQAIGADFDKHDFDIAPYPHQKAQTVEGKYMQFVFGERFGHSDSGDPALVVNSWVSSLQGAGWKLICRCGSNPVTATLRLDQSDREVWVEISMRSADSADVWLVEKGRATSLTLEPPAKEPETFSDQDDFPYLKRFPGSTFRKTVRSDVPLEVEVDSAPPAERKKVIAQGYLQKEYAGAADLSAHEPFVAYRDALTKAGWTITHTFIGTDRSIDAHYTGQGRDLWADLHFWFGGRIEFRVADLGSTQLARQLEEKGRVAVYGIYFDIDSARLRTDSEPALQQVLALLKDNPNLSVEIQGHTDNTSTRAHNQTLSENRAASVKQWLVAHDIDASRLTTKGLADTVPVADNSTESGRAKNRRVELAKK